MTSSESNVSQEDEIFPPHIEEAVTTLAREMGYEDARFGTTVASKLGDGYLSYRVRVQVTSSKPNMKPVQLIVKTPPQNKREAMSVHEMFLNEMNMYSIILPAFAEYMQEKGLINEKHFPGAPRCYKCSIGEKGTEILIMEDLMASGFEMAPERKKGLSKEHCLLVVSFLARLHGTTRAFEIDKPDEFKKIRTKIANVWSRQKVDEFAPMAQKALEMTEKRFPEGTVERAKLRRLVGNYTNEIMRFLEEDPDGFNVVTHGDCWANNMMFKIDPATGKPTEIVIYDYQNARFSSPIGDLFIFLFLNTTREVRGDLSEFLSFYVDEFNKHLSNLGCTKGHITLEMINQKAKKYGRCAVTEATAILPVMLTESSDISDLNEAFDKGKSVANVLTSDLSQQEQNIIEERLCDILEDSIKLGYL